MDWRRVHAVAWYPNVLRQDFRTQGVVQYGHTHAGFQGGIDDPSDALKPNIPVASDINLGVSGGDYGVVEHGLVNRNVSRIGLLIASNRDDQDISWPFFHDARTTRQVAGSQD